MFTYPYSFVHGHIDIDREFGQNVYNYKRYTKRKRRRTNCLKWIIIVIIIIIANFVIICFVSIYLLSLSILSFFTFCHCIFCLFIPFVVIHFVVICFVSLYVLSVLFHRPIHPKPHYLHVRYTFFGHLWAPTSHRAHKELPWSLNCCFTKSLSTQASSTWPRK